MARSSDVVLLVLGLGEVRNLPFNSAFHIHNKYATHILDRAHNLIAEARFNNQVLRSDPKHISADSLNMYTELAWPIHRRLWHRFLSNRSVIKVELFVAPSHGNCLRCGLGAAECHCSSDAAEGVRGGGGGALTARLADRSFRQRLGYFVLDVRTAFNAETHSPVLLAGAGSHNGRCEIDDQESDERCVSSRDNEEGRSGSRNRDFERGSSPARNGSAFKWHRLFGCLSKASSRKSKRDQPLQIQARLLLETVDDNEGGGLIHAELGDGHDSRPQSCDSHQTGRASTIPVLCTHTDSTPSPLVGSDPLMIDSVGHKPPTNILSSSTEWCPQPTKDLSHAAHENASDCVLPSRLHTPTLPPTTGVHRPVLEPDGKWFQIGPCHPSDEQLDLYLSVLILNAENLENISAAEDKQKEAHSRMCYRWYYTLLDVADFSSAPFGSLLKPGWPLERSVVRVHGTLPHVRRCLLDSQLCVRLHAVDDGAVPSATRFVQPAVGQQKQQQPPNGTLVADCIVCLSPLAVMLTGSVQRRPIVLEAKYPLVAGGQIPERAVSAHETRASVTVLLEIRTHEMILAAAALHQTPPRCVAPIGEVCEAGQPHKPPSGDSGGKCDLVHVQLLSLNLCRLVRHFAVFLAVSHARSGWISRELCPSHTGHVELGHTATFEVPPLADTVARSADNAATSESVCAKLVMTNDRIFARGVCAMRPNCLLNVFLRDKHDRLIAVLNINILERLVSLPSSTAVTAVSDEGSRVRQLETQCARMQQQLSVLQDRCAPDSGSSVLSWDTAESRCRRLEQKLDEEMAARLELKSLYACAVSELRLLRTAGCAATVEVGCGTELSPPAGRRVTVDVTTSTAADCVWQRADKCVDTRDMLARDGVWTARGASDGAGLEAPSPPPPPPPLAEAAEPVCGSSGLQNGTQQKARAVSSTTPRPNFAAARNLRSTRELRNDARILNKKAATKPYTGSHRRPPAKTGATTRSSSDRSNSAPPRACTAPSTKNTRMNRSGQIVHKPTIEAQVNTADNRHSAVRTTRASDRPGDRTVGTGRGVASTRTAPSTVTTGKGRTDHLAAGTTTRRLSTVDEEHSSQLVSDQSVATNDAPGVTTDALLEDANDGRVWNDDGMGSESNGNDNNVDDIYSEVSARLQLARRGYSANVGTSRSPTQAAIPRHMSAPAHVPRVSAADGSYPSTGEHSIQDYLSHIRRLSQVSDGVDDAAAVDLRVGDQGDQTGASRGDGHTRLSRLLAEKVSLLNTGYYSNDDPTIKLLDRLIISLD